MAEEKFKDVVGDIVYNEDGNPQNNMIDALTSFILEHWCGAKTKIFVVESYLLFHLGICLQMQLHVVGEKSGHFL